MAIAGTKALELSPHPVLPLEEAKRRGLDVSVIRTCAVRKDGEVAGCNWAVDCRRRMFSRKEHGGFGPQGAQPGAGGDGPQYVQGYHMDAPSMTENEFNMPCYAFMAALYDEYRQQDNTGDIVVLYPLGTAITIQRQVPKKDEFGNLKLVTETSTQEAFKASNPAVDARTEFRRKIRENQQRIRTDSRLDASVERLGGTSGESDDAAGSGVPPAPENVGGTTMAPLKGPRRP